MTLQMNKFINKNFWIIKKTQQFKDLATYFKTRNKDIRNKDIQSDLTSLLFLDLQRRDDEEILDERLQTVVRMNVKRDYLKQIKNAKGAYLHLNKKTNKKVWVQRSVEYDKSFTIAIEDEVYRKKREDDELREYVYSFLSKKERFQLFAIEQAENTIELAYLLNVSESNATTIKKRLKDKIIQILEQSRKDRVA